MKNKSTVVMIEHIVMLLVFALAATVCVRMFVLSEKLSRKYEATDQAVLVAQNAAEILKKNGIAGFAGEPGAAQMEENRWVIVYDSEWKVTEKGAEKFSMEVCYREEENGLLWRAEIVVLTENGEELFRLPVAGQIVAEVTAYEKV